jgi:hypothetical protein
MFDVGVLVRIIGSDGRGPVPDAPPAMVIRRYDGFPSDGVHGSGEMVVYDILFMGRIEYAISGEWLSLIEKQ